MTGMSENLILEHLRAIRSDLAELKLDTRGIRHRMSALEISLAGLDATVANHYTSLASRADRTDDRLERIERRLSLVSA
jgi:hypothetical protein